MTPEAPGMDDVGQQTRAAAFRLLLKTGGAVSAAQIAAATKAAPSAVEADLRRLDAAGRIRLSAEGHVLGSAGLSAAPAAHELWLGSRRFWTWCAYDVVGIVGTLGADARSLSRSPATGAQRSAQRKMEGEVIELDEARRRGL